MPRVKIKVNNPKDPNKKDSLLNILSRYDIYPTDVMQIQDGYVIITTDDDQDKLFQEKIKEEFNQQDFNTITPPELKAKRSVIAFNLNSHIYNNNEDEMKEEIIAHNQWIGENIDTVFKFPNSRNIKITFTQAIYAIKAQEKGLKLFSMKIPFHQIKQEKFYSIMTCFKSYKIEDHLTKKCPQNQDYKICSECNETGHTWRQCNNEQKMCINCGDNHRTLSMKCPARKEAIKKKRLEEREKTTYSQVTKTNTTINNRYNGITHINKEEHLKIYSCMIHAHLMNVIEPGSFEKELNATLKENNLPAIKIPNTPNSSKLLATLAQTEQRDRNQEKEMEEMETPKRNQQPQQQQEEDQVENTERQLRSEDIQLEFYTKESNGWPEDLTITQLAEGVEEEKYKFTYNEDTLEPEEIIILMKRGKINLGNCLRTVEDSAFRKIRSGQGKDRTPPVRQTQRSKTNPK